MFDVLASKGAKKILEYIGEHPNHTSSDINRQLSSQLTTATIYRRLKELELVGFITRKPPHSNSFVLAERGKTILENYIRTRPELTELKRTRRAILYQLKEDPTVNVANLSKKALISPRTLNKELKELFEMGLVEIEQVQSPYTTGGASGPESRSPIKLKSKKGKRGRPPKRHRLTKKGEAVYQQQKQLEEEELQQLQQKSNNRK